MKVTIESGGSKFVFGPAEGDAGVPGDPQQSEPQDCMGAMPAGCSSPLAFRPGDVVRLNSGGPPMTVSRGKEDGHVVCCWMNDTQVFAEEFSVKALHPWSVA